MLKSDNNGPKKQQTNNAVLLLHGAAFSSKIWETLGTFERLAVMGVSSVAIDLPSYKESKSVKIPKNKAGYLNFIRSQFEVLQNHKFIMVSPSMSGGYALPYLLKGKYCNYDLNELFTRAAILNLKDNKKELER